jgi:hypothetical protein
MKKRHTPEPAQAFAVSEQVRRVLAVAHSVVQLADRSQLTPFTWHRRSRCRPRIQPIAELLEPDTRANAQTED